MRAVFLCPGVCHLVALYTVILRCPRTYSGRMSVLPGWSVRTVGCSTDGHGRAAPAARSGLTCGVPKRGIGVLPASIPVVAVGVLAGSRGCDGTDALPDVHPVSADNTVTPPDLDVRIHAAHAEGSSLSWLGVVEVVVMAGEGPVFRRCGCDPVTGR